MAKKTRSPPIRNPIDTEIGGKRYEGTYEIDRGMITVRHGWRHKTTQVGGSASNPAPPALMMLLEMIRESGTDTDRE